MSEPETQFGVGLRDRGKRLDRFLHGGSLGCPARASNERSKSA
jgi:hypothetical protein